MPDFGRRIVVAVGALLLIMAQLALIGPAAAAETDPGYLTLLFARAQMRATDGCTPVPGSVSLFEIADELSARGIVASAAVVTNQTSESAETCLDDIGTYASWDQLAGLRDDHSWTMVSTGKAHADITQLTLAGQLEESCGSLEPLEAHGHDRAWGLFGYANDRYTVAIQESTVSTCFAYGRTYASDGTPRNQRAALASPWFQETLSVNGGECNDAASPCYELDGVSRRYMSPQWLGEHMAVGSDEWLVVQTYRFVEGANLDPTSTNQFDCTSPDWRDHWTARPELYCLDDYLGAVDYAVAQGGTGLITTDAATVAEAWGRQRPQQVTDTIPPNGVVEVPAANQVVTSLPVQMSGTATDDTAVGEARVAIKDRVSGLWYHADGTWGAYQYQLATLTAPGTTATNWSFNWTPPPNGSGSYAFGLATVDSAGNIDPTKPWTSFTVTTGGATDTIPPNGVVEVPAANQVVTSLPVQMSGTATDDTAVGEARVAIKDRVSGLWYHADGTWGAYQYQLATLTAPGTTATNWSFNWTPPPNGSGSYAFGLATVDSAGNIDPTKPWTSFTVTTP